MYNIYHVDRNKYLICFGILQIKLIMYNDSIIIKNKTLNLNE